MEFLPGNTIITIAVRSVMENLEIAGFLQRKLTENVCGSYPFPFISLHFLRPLRRAFTNNGYLW